MGFFKTAFANLTLRRLLPLGFAVLYAGFAALHFASVGNTEFLGYIAVIVLLIVLGGCVLAHQCVPAWLLWLVSLVGFFHMLGAAVMVGGDVLYNYVPFPIENPTGLTFIKFDQIVHTYGSAVAATLSYFFLRNRGFHWFGLFVLSVLAAMGIGALNEIVEFAAKLAAPESNVGGYYNTAVDLSVNLLGSLLGALFAVLLWKRQRQS